MLPKIFVKARYKPASLPRTGNGINYAIGEKMLALKILSR